MVLISIAEKWLKLDNNKNGVCTIFMEKKNVWINEDYKLSLNFYQESSCEWLAEKDILKI